MKELSFWKYISYNIERWFDRDEQLLSKSFRLTMKYGSDDEKKEMLENINNQIEIHLEKVKKAYNE